MATTCQRARTAKRKATSSTEMASKDDNVEEDAAQDAPLAYRSEFDSVEEDATNVVSSGYDDRPLGLDAPPQLEDLPPPAFYVCDARPHKKNCLQCSQVGICSYSKWDGYRVKPGIALHDVNPDGTTTLSGLPVDINQIVVAYLGRFCQSTYVAYINPAPRENFCNYCRAWGHQFDFTSCTELFEHRMDGWLRDARAKRDRERQLWRNAREAKLVYIRR
jgi:hypothetical protein